MYVKLYILKNIRNLVSTQKKNQEKQKIRVSTELINFVSKIDKKRHKFTHDRIEMPELKIDIYIIICK